MNSNVNDIYDRWANEIVAQHYDGDPRILHANEKQLLQVTRE